MLFYFLWGSLPWQGLGKEDAILEGKRTITTHSLFLFLALPADGVTHFFEHCRSLSFDQKPNYDHFYDLFGKLILREGFQLDMAFDWDVAGGKSQPGCTDKSVALQHERNHSPKRITLYVPCILSTHYSINISLHSDNGLYADCALSMAR
jgi:hypothetical protein